MTTAWTIARRPLFACFVLACSASMLVSWRVSPRLIAGELLNWAVVPLLEVAAFLAVVQKPQLADRFFRNHLPWLFWVVAFSLDPYQTPLRFWTWLYATIPVAAWCVYLDVKFFRDELQREWLRAIRDIVLLRAICWSGVAFYFFGYDILPELARLAS